MSTSVVPFSFEGHEVRSILDEHGEPWFVARDIAEVLGFRDAYNATQCLDADEKGTCKVSTLGGTQDATIISYSGVLALILRSNKPEAKPFRKWITSEVVPSIMRTGRYESAGEIAKGHPRPSSGVTAVVMAEEFRGCKLIGELCGLSGNPLLISANNGVRSLYGPAADPLRIIGLELKSESQDRLLTPTEIGKMLNPPRKAAATNDLLASLGLQTYRYDHRKTKTWELTDAGKKYGVLLDSGKRHKESGAMIQQIKWKAEVVAVVQDELDANPGTDATGTTTPTINLDPKKDPDKDDGDLLGQASPLFPNGTGPITFGGGVSFTVVAPVDDVIPGAAG